MKKIICVMIMLSIFLSTNVNAVDAEMANLGAYAFGAGAGIFALPWIFDFKDKSFSNNLGAYLSGGALGLLGFGVMIWGLVRDDPNYYAKLKSPFPDVVSITSDGTSTFIGTKFSLK